MSCGDKPETFPTSFSPTPLGNFHRIWDCLRAFSCPRIYAELVAFVNLMAELRPQHLHVLPPPSEEVPEFCVPRLAKVSARDNLPLNVREML